MTMHNCLRVLFAIFATAAVASATFITIRFIVGFKRLNQRLLASNTDRRIGSGA